MCHTAQRHWKIPSISMSSARPAKTGSVEQTRICGNKRDVFVVLTVFHHELYMSLIRKLSLALAGLLLTTGCCIGQQVDSAIAKQIDSIWAVDNHAHPVLSPPLDKTDREFDAL